MALALSLARARVGLVGARPAVGAVIVKDGRVLGRGATGPDGRPHAEALALEEARSRYGGDSLGGASAYVTLEPCAHHGRTAPCADALIAAGIARVVSTIEDPDPRVSGRGFAALSAAGIDVVTGVRAAEAAEVNRGFLKRIATGRPWVTLKLAATLDGRIATAKGESRWITGSGARRLVHLMRLRSDAVMIGAGTARADDPMLDVRGYGAVTHPPVRVVMDGGLSISPESRLARTAGDLPTLIFHGEDADSAHRASLLARGVSCESIGSVSGRLDPEAALRVLGRRGINRVLVEGGAGLAASLIKGGQVDEIALFTAGKAIGGDGLGSVGPLGVEGLGDAPEFSLSSVTPVGGDVLTLWHRS